MGSYAYPEVLVETSWVDEHLGDAGVRIVEVDVNTTSYREAHIPGAVGWDWSTELCDVAIRDILSREAFEALMARSGILPGSTVILYGDNNNWFAAWAFWQMKIYGHADVRLMNGGRTKWLEEGRELTLETPIPPPTEYRAAEPDLSLRAMLPDVLAASREAATSLVDVRSPPEFTGELLAPAGLPETCQRGGHIPGACNVPWNMSCNPDGTFKSRADLEALYGGQGVSSDRPAIAYCRIGERSSHTWFVLKYLLGLERVSNYDGSWTEWGNLVGAPIER